MIRKAILSMVILSMTVLMLAGCGDEQNGGNGGLIEGKNAFGVGVTIKCLSSDAVKFFVEPTKQEYREAVEEHWADGGMEAGVFGTVALVPGKKKGGGAEMDGAFTVYVNDKSGPSVSVSVQGTYNIDEVQSYYFIYTDDGLKQVTQQVWKTFQTNKDLM
ncbi:MAG TPA: hypothetical protein VN462_04650 [Negativicutes bacterium]|nr:hypothetical protein [Negativicutes bacterium]